MIEIEEVKRLLMKEKKYKQANISWWNILRKAEYHWQNKDYFVLHTPDPDIWVFEESRKEYYAVIVLLLLALIATFSPPLFILITLTQANTVGDRLFILSAGVTLVGVAYIIAYILWSSFLYRLFSSLSQKKIILDRKLGLCILNYQPWLFKELKVEVPLSSLQIKVKDELTYNRRMLRYVYGEIEFSRFQLFHSNDRKEVDQFVKKLKTFLKQG